MGDYLYLDGLARDEARKRNQILTVARQNFKRYYKHETSNAAFAAFLGDPFEENKRYFIVNIANPEIMAKIDKLAGPHYHTFFKIMEIQNADRRKDAKSV